MTQVRLNVYGGEPLQLDKEPMRAMWEQRKWMTFYTKTLTEAYYSFISNPDKFKESSSNTKNTQPKTVL